MPRGVRGGSQARLDYCNGYLRGYYKGSVAVKRLELDFRLVRPQYILVEDIPPVGKGLNKRGYQPSKVRES